MDWKTILSSAPYHLAVSMEECPFSQFWVVMLTNGCEVYQNEPDNSLTLHNPWLRLSKFCEDYPDINIAGMAMVDTKNPDKQINLPGGADGYFYSKRAYALVCAGPFDFHGHDEGVGYLDGQHLIIYWRHPNGDIEVERRDLPDKDHKHGNHLALIRSTNGV